MSHKKYFSYIRVSTQRQGQHGTSLSEQQAAIERFAQSWNLPIVKRFEERETAAKQGRPIFLEMLKQLRTGNAAGVIIHKIDRSARNLKDWADLGSLIDNGLEVHFASESLDLNSRGGRLSADIQAVVASDYIRNLREETIKGMYGRLRQGLYPFRAVVGYVNMGRGKPKRIDPIAGPLVRKAFELYSSGSWGLIALKEKLYRLGLRSKTGKKLTINGVATMLHNPFYKGVIAIRKSGETFAGIHEPIVTRELFHKVQDVFAGKTVKKETRHFFTFRRLISCTNCNKLLVPEIQKGITYYRCRTKNCLRKCLKEKEISYQFLSLARRLNLSDKEFQILKAAAESQLNNSESQRKLQHEQIILQLSKLKDRSSRVIDAFVDGVFDNDTYIEKKKELVETEHVLKERLVQSEQGDVEIATQLDVFCELANSAYLSYKEGSAAQKRDLVQIMCANLSTNGESVLIKLKDPFRIVAERSAFPVGSPCRDTTRTITTLAQHLVKFFQENPHSLKSDTIEQPG